MSSLATSKPSGEGGEPPQSEPALPSPESQTESSSTHQPTEVIDLTLEDDYHHIVQIAAPLQDDLAVNGVKVEPHDLPHHPQNDQETQQNPELSPERAMPQISITVARQTAPADGFTTTTGQQSNDTQAVSSAGDKPEYQMQDLHDFLNAHANGTFDDEDVDGYGGSDSLGDPLPNPNSDDENNLAVKAFKTLQRKFDAKKRKRETDSGDEVEFTRARVAESMRLRLRQRKHANNREPTPEENGMFFPEDTGGYAYVDGHASEDVMDETPAKRAKKAKRPEISSRELQDSMSLAFEAVEKKRNGRPKGRKQQSAGAKRTKATTTRVNKTPSTRGRPAQRGKKKQTRQEKQEAARARNLLNEDTLFHNDIVGVAQANVGREGQKKFIATTREKALQELVASIPTEHRDTALATKKQIDDACKVFTCGGNRSISADGGNWRLKGMKTSLFSYQLIGAAFMRERENSTVAPFGGIVADSMGFGKTVLCIANIVDDMRQIDNNNRSTLIVCPSSLCTQWMSEIDKHTDSKVVGDVLLYKSGSRLLSSDVVNSIGRYGIVITTYNEIVKSWPFAETPNHLQTPAKREEWWANFFQKNVGPLHLVKWRRIVLDEGHLIKNHESRTFKAVVGLHGKYRWALSGTPVQNRRNEFYSMFAFLKVRHISSYADFTKKFCNGSDDAGKRLQLMLRSIMIRRTLANEMFGRPILVLPPLDHQTIQVEFNPIERAVYRIITKRFIARLNAWIATHAHGIKSQYRSIFPFFLRLRMVCSHILLIQPTIKDLLELEDVEELFRVTQKFDNDKQDEGTRGTISILRQMLAKRTSCDPIVSAADTEPIFIDDDTELTEPPEINRGMGGQFGKTFDFFNYLATLGSAGYFKKMNERALCSVCREKPDHPQLILPCYCLFCRTCLEEEKAKADVQAHAFGCPKCGEEYHEHVPCVGFDSTMEHVKSRYESTPGKKRRSKSGTPRDDMGNEMDWLNQPDYVLPSAKTLAVKAQLLNWFSQDDNARVIIFTQFIGIVHIMGRICQLEGWDYCTYTGRMGTDARERELEEFRNNPEKKILIMSMKAGSLGLNLTRANKVCILDPWWNSSVEAQAYSRVYRIGQESPVEIRRFVVKESIDTELLLVMQQRKDEDIDDAMSEENIWRQLSVREMLRLFGQVHYEDGVPVIEEGQSEFTLVEDQPADDVSDGSVPPEAPPAPFH